MNTIGEKFFNDIHLEVLHLPKSVERIEKMAFAVTPLKVISIRDSVKSIGESAFRDCPIVSIELPPSVSFVGEKAFAYCVAHDKISLPENIKKISVGLFQGCERLSSIVLPDSIISIEQYAFDGCSKLLSINIPMSVTSIDSYAFNGCTSLSEVNIPARIASIGEYAFYKTALKEVLLPSSVKKIGDYAFGGNSGIEKVLSLNTTPPEIFTNTFDSDVEASIPLHVQKGSLMYYWLDPVWKEFKNISDDMLCLQAIPNAKYGDGEIDLSQYAPEGVALTYQSSNEDVVRINGSSMRIVGAGEATVGAILDEDGTITELVGQLHSIVVDKADLTVSVEEIVI